jgi:hypothetical protein
VKTITMRLHSPDVSREMARMRTWLDHHGYTPRRFDCDRHGDEVVFSVVFMTDTDAEAFAARFRNDGNPLEPEDDGLPPSPAI